MKRRLFLLAAGLLAVLPSAKAQETQLKFDCGVYYFSQGPYAGQTQFESFIQKTEQLINADLAQVEGPLRGSVTLNARYAMGAGGERAQELFQEVHPAVVLIEGGGAEKFLRIIRDSGKFPRILIYVNVPDAAGLKPDFEFEKAVSIFGQGAPPESALKVEKTSRDFNLKIQGSAHVNLWQDSKVQDFTAEVIKIAVLESLFPPEKKEEIS